MTAEVILKGDRRALARAATHVENGTPAARALLSELFAHTGRAAIYGITGPAGAGKSTVTSACITLLRADGKRVGVIAVDPSSAFTGGAILGDRIRMQAHHADPEVFIRSMATRGALGGLARATLDMTVLLDAAGFDVVLVETVGAGQDEVDVVRLADVTAVVLAPGMGDDVQAIKAGIMEIADVFVLNKADQPGVDRLEREIEAMLGLNPSGRRPPIIRVVATEGAGIDTALRLMHEVRERRSQAPRVELWRTRLLGMLRDRVMQVFPADEVQRAAEQVAARASDPYVIVEEWLRRYLSLQPEGRSNQDRT